MHEMGLAGSLRGGLRRMGWRFAGAMDGCRM